jgi:hypothetical protein
MSFNIPSTTEVLDLADRRLAYETAHGTLMLRHEFQPAGV